MYRAVAELFPWEESYAVGDPTIDAQHRQLNECINRLHEAIVDGSAQDILARLLAELISYIHAHFRDEEALMEAANYPSLAAHRQLHQEMTRKIMDFQHQFIQGRDTLSLNLLKFLKSWFEDHTLHVDRAFWDYLQALPK